MSKPEDGYGLPVEKLPDPTGEILYNPDLKEWAFVTEDGKHLIKPYATEAEAIAARDEYYRGIRH